MIDNLADIRIFVAVVTTGSQTSAAEDLGLSLAVISKRLGALEKTLGIRLLNRSTRRQSLTHEGSVFYESCLRILAELQAAEESVTEAKGVVRGLLSIAAPRTFGRSFIVPLAAAFQSANPDITMRLEFSDEVQDIVQEGIDIAFRFGKLKDSTLSAKPIAPNYRILCASPGYLQRNGSPVKVDELSEHACIVYGKNVRSWKLYHKGKPISAKIRNTFSVNDGDAALELALGGSGILYKSIWDIAEHLAHGRLVRVLEDHSAPSEPLSIVFQHARQLPPRVRRFIDYSYKRLKGYWDDDSTAPGIKVRNLRPIMANC